MPADTEQTRVFIVEDEQSLADLYEVWLTDEYDTQVAYSGDVALEAIANHGIDVVLLDRRMPGLSGDEVANRLDENGCDAQVIMVTAVSPSPEMVALPIDDYIQKPVERAVTVDSRDGSPGQDVRRRYHRVTRPDSTAASVGGGRPHRRTGGK
jgi:DNA-binding NtrC family response regulator